MKNKLLRFYLLFMLMTVALFSCENHEITQDSSAIQSILERKPESRHPIDPNEAPVESSPKKKSQRKYVARSSNWC